MSPKDCKCGCAPMRGFNHVPPSKAKPPPTPYRLLCDNCARKLTKRELAAGRTCADRRACSDRAAARGLKGTIAHPYWTLGVSRSAPEAIIDRALAAAYRESTS